ncbi:biotin transporter BioY [Lactonifactor longoviformis]|uniref:biotin transporter BioY n=1 Tax=Lactonifactor longoviformis TaxID=341220 RepID=UPI00210E865F|nr:biotin transporter BioY [Lactonifactor longoviformis]MCQ4671557.1 biotin transporter BioY [Lactonifactor longoviformis]
MEMVYAGLFTALIAIGAFIQVPVPGMDYFTLQFLFVLMAGMVLGSRLGAVSVGVYVLLGLLGLPVFAAGGGFGYIFRPSFGYLIGFIAAAFAAGFVTEKLRANSYKKYLWAAFAGFAVTYSIGLVYKYLMLNLYVGEKTAFAMVLADCFPLDMPGDVVLCLVSAMIAVRLVPAARGMALKAAGGQRAVAGGIKEDVSVIYGKGRENQ